MHLGLRDGLHFCNCAGRIIFLDVHTDRYFALSGKTDQAFRAWIAGEVTVEEPDEHLNCLMRAGLLVLETGEGRIGMGPSLARATRDFQPRPVESAFLVGAKAFLLRYGARRNIRSQSFAAVVRDVRERKAALTSLVQDAVAEISLACKAFGSTGWAFPSRDQCLPESIAFHRLCLNRGVPASLFIGVSVNPFVAHCWVQHADAVINDRVERIRQFTPILEI
ncbi:MAG TPA: lasso peptide biosynthesis B2 protein [Novosphingobium sp.]|nr:lasso peptide biosynthesis B2 protein [Novosphingobium sp.]